MSNLQINMLTSYMDVNFNKYSNVSFFKFVCTVFITCKNHIQVLNRSSKAGATLVKTITSLFQEAPDLPKKVSAGVGPGGINFACLVRTT